MRRLEVVDSTMKLVPGSVVRPSAGRRPESAVLIPSALVHQAERQLETSTKPVNINFSWGFSFHLYASIHRVSEQPCQHFFDLRRSNMNIFQQKLVYMSWKKHLTIPCKKCPLHLKYVLALPWEIWSVRLSHKRSRSIYIYVNFNELSNSYKTTGSYCLEKRQTCSKSYHLHIICSKYLPPRKHKHVDAAPRRQPHARWTAWFRLFACFWWVVSVWRYLRS